MLNITLSGLNWRVVTTPPDLETGVLSISGLGDKAAEIFPGLLFNN